MVSLRDQLNTAEAQVRDLRGSLRRLQEQLARMQRKRDQGQADLARVAAELEAMRPDWVATTGPTVAEPSLNRAQRRVLDRRAQRGR